MSTFSNKENATIKILLVDDDPSCLKLYKLKFELDGFDVRVAKDGKEGLEKAIADAPNIILLDIKIPEMDGLELLKNLKNTESLSNTSVVVFSNFDDQELIEKSLSIGAKDYIVKSQFTPEEISTKIKTLVR
ncbi:MAG: response regulator transcription factor [Candidatus Woykebacteria bacterium]